MKKILFKYFICYIAILLVVFLAVHYSAEAGKREKIWSDIMLFVNFGIIVFFYVRFAHKPLANFLKGQGSKIGEQLQSIEADVKDARNRMEAEAMRLKNLNDDLTSITESIIAAGAREKETILERAQAVAEKMISDAKKEAEFKMLAAKKRFSEEMLNAAINITADTIKRNITMEDEEKLVTAFSSDLGSVQNITL